MAKLSDARIALAALRGGFPADEVATAVAIALAESDGDPLAKGTNGPKTNAPGTHDLGLFQVNDFYHQDLLKKYDWRDPDQSADMAYIIWYERLNNDKHGGDGWTAWSTYNSGSYVKFLPRGATAARRLYPWKLTRYLFYKGRHDYMQGEDVKQLQRVLGFHHASVDGLFGEQTRDAVKAFQSLQRLDTDSVVGPKTCKALLWTWSGPR